MSITEPEIEIIYALSQKYRENHFAENGKHPDRKQKVTFDPEELSEEARRKVLKEGRVSGTNGSRIYLKMNLPKLKTTSKRIGGIEPASLPKKVRVSDWPKLKDGNMVSNFLTRDEPLGAGDVAEAIDTWRAREKEILEKHERHLSKALSRVIEKMEEHCGSFDDDSYSKPLVLNSRVLNKLEGLDGYDRLKSLQDEAKNLVEKIEDYNERRRKDRKKKKQEERERRKSEREEWIRENGSDHLQEAREEGYDCQRRYVLERVRSEYNEDFYVDFDKEHEYNERSCPSEEAFRFAQETDAKVVWLESPGSEKPDENNRKGFQSCEAVRKRVTLGQHGKTYTLIREFG